MKVASVPTDGVRAGNGLVERESELLGITAILSRAHLGEGSICVFEGEPGLGKTTLLGAAEEVAGAEGVQVLAATCRPLERDFPYGVVLQLFEQRLAQATPAESKQLLAGAARLAAPLLLGDPGPGQPNDLRGFSVDHGLYWLCSNLTEKGPLALVIDDARWVDPATLRFFVYLAQRIRELPVVLVLGWSAADSVELRELAAHPATTIFPLRPLTIAAVSRLVDESLPGQTDASFDKACSDATGGNPFLLRELTAELAARGIEPSSRRAADVASIAPGSVTNSVFLRLRAVGDGALELAQAVAVLGGDAEIRLAARLAQIPQPEATEIAKSLIEAAVLAPERTLSFVHPIVQAAVYHELSEPGRAEAHRRAARLLHGEHVPAEQVSAHFLSAAAAGDRWVVDVLLTGAAEAMRKGDPASAVRLLERALLEPPEADQRAAVVLALGRAEVRVASPHAVDRLRRAMALMEDPRERASAALDAARLLLTLGRSEEGLSTLEDALSAVEDLPGLLRTRLEAEVAAARRVAGRGGGSEESRFELDLPDDAHETADGRFLIAQLAYEAALEGRAVSEVRGLATRALAGGTLLEEETADGIGFYLAAQALTLAEDFEAAELALGAAVEDASRRGSVLGHASASCYRGLAIFGRGRVEEAAADLENCLAGEQYGWALALPTARAALAQCQIERGDLGAAERTLTLGEQTGGDPEALGRWRLLAGRGHLRLVTAQYQEALDDLLEGGRRQELIGALNPAVYPWRSVAAVAMSALGDRAEAIRIAEEELRLVRAFGAPGAIGNTLRTLGTISAGASALETLEEAVRVLEGSGAELRRAGAYVDFGSALRRTGRRRDARGPLLEGMGLSARCGARSLARRARQELIAAGGRPRRAVTTGLDSLTPRERQTARLAAEGLSNRAIAESMFVTLKTVEWHLGNTYDKLGVSARSELESILLSREKV